MLEPSEPGRGWTVLLVGLLAAGAMLGRRPARRGAGARSPPSLALIPLFALTLLAGPRPRRAAAARRLERARRAASRAASPTCRACACPTAASTSGCARTSRSAARRSSCSPRARVLAAPRPARLPVLALLALVVLYVVPVVALNFTAEFVRGAVFTLLMVAFLRLEKLRRADAAAAAALALVATFVAVAAAPALNRDTPWFDYETWASRPRPRGRRPSPGSTTTTGSTGRATAASCCACAPASPRTGRPRTSTSTTAALAALADGQSPCRSARRTTAARRPLDADDPGIDPQPAHGPVHHGRRGARRRHPAAGHDPDARRARGPAAHAAPRRHLHGRRLHAAPVGEPAPPLERRLRRAAEPTTRR